MYRELGGIQNVDAGYKTVKIHPDFNCGLKSLNCEQHTPNGILRVQWKEAGDGFYSMKVTIPCNTRAQIQIPDQKDVCIGSGEYEFSFKK